MLTFSESKCAEARWSEVFMPFLGDWLVVGELAHIDYQGDAEALLTKGEKFAYVEWSYGSCESCDSWMDLSEEEVSQAAHKQIMFFSSSSALQKWREMLVESQENDLRLGHRPREDQKRKIAWIDLALPASVIHPRSHI